MIYRMSNGGHLWHLFNTDTETRALCGYKPSSPQGKMIRNRGGWVAKRDTSPGENQCERCMIKFVARRGKKERIL